MVSPETRLGDRYLLTERLAAGGMGVVWLADEERLGREVAVKVLTEGLAQDQRFIERFRREARAVASLSHPNIAQVFDYGEDEGSSYIVMELVRGRDLARVLREEGTLSFERATRVATGVADALGHAHSQGIVHRDVKPGNVLIGTNEQVKVTDFGIARAAGDTTLTATGSVLGSAHYLSPEQATGAPVGAPSDVYSLGIVLYEMLTGSLPFTGDSAVAVAMRQASEDVPDLTELRPDAPDHLRAIVAKATAKDPQSRFADGDAMAAALRGEDLLAPTAPLTAGAGVAPTAKLPTATARMPISNYNPVKVGRGVLVVGLLLLRWRSEAASGALQVRDRVQGDRRRGGRSESQPRATPPRAPRPHLSRTPQPSSFPKGSRGSRRPKPWRS